MEEIVIHAHFFVASCDRWAAEFDGKDTFWGFVNLGDPQNAEWGPFLLSELRDLRFQMPVHDGYTKVILGHLPVQVEWDEHWRPKPFGEIRWEA